MGRKLENAANSTRAAGVSSAKRNLRVRNKRMMKAACFMAATCVHGPLYPQLVSQARPSLQLLSLSSFTGTTLLLLLKVYHNPACTDHSLVCRSYACSIHGHHLSLSLCPSTEPGTNLATRGKKKQNSLTADHSQNRA
uniref:Uncharacterized protein n=1 Tax=Rhipicephalus zambeziensis TaxID=60191 RepID=A0A224YGB7_9ACAR